MCIGYFEAHRLCTIADEINSYKLEQLSFIIDSQNANLEYRNKVNDWISSRQPRRKPSNKIPENVLKAFEEKWKNG